LCQHWTGRPRSGRNEPPPPQQQLPTWTPPPQQSAATATTTTVVAAAAATTTNTNAAAPTIRRPRNNNSRSGLVLPLRSEFENSQATEKGFIRRKDMHLTDIVASKRKVVVRGRKESGDCCYGGDVCFLRVMIASKFPDQFQSGSRAVSEGS
jgi:hypothetical protein